MEMIYAALLLHSAGKDIDEANMKKVLEAAGASVDEAQIKAVVSNLKEVDIDEAIKQVVTMPTAAAPSEEKSSEAKEEEKKEEKKEEAKSEEAIAGLGALFG